MSNSTSLFNRAISASRWSILAELAHKGLPPVLFLVLASFLSPKDFGVIAVVAMLISFSQVFWDSGFAKALVQSVRPIEETANEVFWTNLLCACLFYFLVVFIAPFVAIYLDDSRIETVLQVQGIQIILLALCSVQNAIFQKELKFRQIFWIRLTTTLVPSFISIPLAVLGMGVWALVIGVLIGNIAQLVMLWHTCRWRPSLRYHFHIALELLKFGKWIMLSGVLAWFFLWMDSLVVGLYLDVHTLGLYRTGNAFVIMVFAILLSPVMPVLFSTLSLIQSERFRVIELTNRVTKYIAYIVLPAAVLLYFCSGTIETLLFADQWQRIGMVIGMLALAHSLSWLVSSYMELYRAIGKPQVESYIMLIGVCFYLPTYIFVVQQGLQTFLWARLLLAGIGISVHLYFLNRVLDISPLSWIKIIRWPACNSAIMLVLLLALRNIYNVGDSALDVIPFAIFGLICFLLGIFIMDREFVKQDCLPLIRRALNLQQ